MPRPSAQASGGRPAPLEQQPAKTHKTALVIVPPAQLWPPIQAIRERYDRQVHRWMPHINLLYPFAPPRRWGRLGPRLAQACAGLSAFTLRLTQVRSFKQPGGHFVLWLAPEPVAPLRELRARLLRAAPGYDDTASFAGGFAPHLTIGQVARRASALALQQGLQGEWTVLELPVDQVCLIQRDDPPRDQFRVVQVFPLGHRSAQVR
jgi:RNA 2',3'-cyclic 3'-phosphodiesterase